MLHGNDLQGLLSTANTCSVPILLQSVQYWQSVGHQNPQHMIHPPCRRLTSDQAFVMNPSFRRDEHVLSVDISIPNPDQESAGSTAASDQIGLGTPKKKIDCEDCAVMKS